MIFLVFVFNFTWIHFSTRILQHGFFCMIYSTIWIFNYLICFDLIDWIEYWSKNISIIIFFPCLFKVFVDSFNYSKLQSDDHRYNVNVDDDKQHTHPPSLFYNQFFFSLFFVLKINKCLPSITLDSLRFWMLVGFLFSS